MAPVAAMSGNAAAAAQPSIVIKAFKISKEATAEQRRAERVEEQSAADRRQEEFGELAAGHPLVSSSCLAGSAYRDPCELTRVLAGRAKVVLTPSVQAHLAAACASTRAAGSEAEMVRRNGWGAFCCWAPPASGAG